MRSACRSLFVISLCAASLAAADTDIHRLVEGNHWKRARAILEPRVKANSSDADAVALLSAVRNAFGNHDEAMQLAERAVALKPDVAAYHWQLAQLVGDEAEKAGVLRQFGLARRFKSEAETAIRLDPKYIEPRHFLISYYIKVPGIAGGDKKKADAMVGEIARIDPGAGFLARAQALSDAGATGDFESLYRQAAEAGKAPEVKYKATVKLANWYTSQKPPRYDAAEPLMRTLVSLDPSRVNGYRGLAIIHALASKWADLDADLAACEQAVPDDLTPYFRAGLILLGSGADNARAERYLRKYLTQEPEPGNTPLANAHWRLGQLLEKEGRRADAITEIDQATKINPKLEDAVKDLTRLRAAR